MKHSVWQEHQHTVDVNNFRGESHYLSQLHESEQAQYEAQYFSIKERYPELLNKMTEDGAFGVKSFEIDGRMVTRDLLDSVNELGFIDRHLGLNKLKTVIDIGAGYGRFAHRLYEVAPHVKTHCYDAINVSTECCYKYLSYRNVPANVIPFGPKLSAPLNPDLAVNIHSWSECTQESIDFWLQFLKLIKVPKLMVIPHSDYFYSVEGKDSEGDIYKSYYHLFEKYGYHEVVRERKLPMSVNGLYPTVYSLFEWVNK